MSWLESQIDIRARLDSALTERAYAELAASVSDPRRAPRFTADDFEQTDGAVKACLKYNGGGDHDKLRVMRIRDTLHMNEIMISEALVPEAIQHPGMEVLGDPVEMRFDEAGRLLQG